KFHVSWHGRDARDTTTAFPLRRVFTFIAAALLSTPFVFPNNYVSSRSIDLREGTPGQAAEIARPGRRPVRRPDGGDYAPGADQGHVQAGNGPRRRAGGERRGAQH